MLPFGGIPGYLTPDVSASDGSPQVLTPEMLLAHAPLPLPTPVMPMEEDFGHNGVQFQGDLFAPLSFFDDQDAFINNTMNPAIPDVGNTNLLVMTGWESGMVNVSVPQIAPRVLQCGFCLENFTRPQDLRRHLPRHSPDPRRYSCQLCEKHYSRKDSVQRHHKKCHANQS
ncbi:hypothetical protein BC940DRAFT_297422 [Gongronella butleri]|nr:hypothetical protein BC940DRAFT_297422 [Gongronella butleri]